MSEGVVRAGFEDDAGPTPFSPFDHTGCASLVAGCRRAIRFGEWADL